MRRMRWFVPAVLLMGVVPAVHAAHQGLEVELWTDRGSDAVYQPGDRMEVRVRSSDDGFLLVYEIDSEGYVRLLWPDRGSRGFVEGRRTLEVPSERSNYELVVEAPTGQGYLVAIVSREPFRDLPWYLRPYDEQAEGAGYLGDPDDEEGITREGRIVGDPFVAMERIRRRVLEHPDDADAFGSAYASYYVHERVRYPRYLCYDCHRPSYWAWWDGFDPYYAHCSVFDFRVNWHWYWGPRYWFGYVPYYYFIYRYDCPPPFRVFSVRHLHHSSWDGWRKWSSLWGGSLRRYKSPPPPDYVPPDKYKGGTGSPKAPPGLLPDRAVARGRHDGAGPRLADSRWRGIERVETPRQPGRGAMVGRPRDPSGGSRGDAPDSETGRSLRGIREREGDGLRWVGRGRGRADQAPRREASQGPDRGHRDPDAEARVERPGRQEQPRYQPPPERRVERPRYERPREEHREEPRYERPRQERLEEPRKEPKVDPPPRQEPKPGPPPRQERPESRGGGEWGKVRRPGR